MYGMTAGNQDTGFIGLLVTTAKYLMNCLFCHGILDCHDIHGKLWFAAHGIDITDCIAGGNLSEKVWIIRNRRKKINRLYDCGIIIDFIYRCIITFVESNQKPLILLNRKILQKL